MYIYNVCVYVYIYIYYPLSYPYIIHYFYDIIYDDLMIMNHLCCRRRVHALHGPAAEALGAAALQALQGLGDGGATGAVAGTGQFNGESGENWKTKREKLGETWEINWDLLLGEKNIKITMGRIGRYSKYWKHLMGSSGRVYWDMECIRNIHSKWGGSLWRNRGFEHPM